MKSFYKEITFAEIDYSAEKMLEVLHQNKVTMLRGYEGQEDPFEFFTKLSDQLGEIVPSDEDLVTGQPTGKRWIDITYDPAMMNKYRSAPVGQPLHTDASYSPIRDNVQFFYCAGQAELGGATTFIDGHTVVKLLEMAEETALLEDLKKHKIRFAKDNRERITPILWKEDDTWHFNWNYYTGAKENNEFEKELFERFHNFLETRVVRSGLVTEAMLEKNDAVFFHDELVLHGRNSYFATEKGQRSLRKGTILLKDLEIS
jgi:alpha-ketoglutarate-dependent taurine dioxygenase